MPHAGNGNVCLITEDYGCAQIRVQCTQNDDIHTIRVCVNPNKQLVEDLACSRPVGLTPVLNPILYPNLLVKLVDLCIS